MGGRGFVAGPAESLARPTNAKPVKVLEQDDLVRGPDLPPLIDVETGMSIWHEMTIRWYESMRRYELAQTFVTTDWEYLIDTAMLHTQMWRGDTKLAAELRQRMASFGITPEHRARLRLTVKTPAEQAAAAQAAAHEASVAEGRTVEMDDRRAALGK